VIIAFRHGKFPLNGRSCLTGEAAFSAMEIPIPPDADSTMDLLPEGREQARSLQGILARYAIYACLRSPHLRAKTTAEIALAGHSMPGGMHVVPELRERSRGKFSYAPDAWADLQPDYPRQKSVLDWLPAGIDYNGDRGESIRHIRDTRVLPVLDKAHETAPDRIVALSTHAEWMLSLRAYYLGFNDDRFRQPLVPKPLDQTHTPIPSKMIVNGQLDMYDCDCPVPLPPNNPARHADLFRTIGTVAGTEFDTDWLPIEEMR
jgi:broad specificity phosphatase PhoE